MLKKLQQLLSQKVPEQQQPIVKAIDGLQQSQVLSLVLMTEIALADGEFSADERQHLLNDLKNEYQLSQTQAEQAVHQAQQEVEQAASLQHFTAPLKELPYADKVDLLEGLWRLAYADNQLDPYEESMLRKLADLLYIDHADYIKSKLRVTDSL